MPREPLYPHYPKSRQPQFPHVSKSRQAMEQLPHALPQAGTCYEDAWRFVVKEGEGTLVHGTVWSTLNARHGKRIGHAWVETPGYYARIWEPETKKFYDKLTFEYERAPVEEHRYTAEEAAIMAARTKHFGPWTDQERRQYLKEKSPAVIPTEPRRPHPGMWGKMQPAVTTKEAWVQRLGDCYTLAWRFIMDKKEGWLVHGEVYAGTPLRWIQHAWVELPSDIVFEPVADAFYRKETFYEGYKAKELGRYDVEEAAIMAARAKHFGPWSEDERRQYLAPERLPEVTIEGGEPIPARYRHLVSLVSEPLPKEAE